MKFVRPFSRSRRGVALSSSDAARRRVGVVSEELEPRRLMARMLGIDVSYYQGSAQNPPTTINWTSVKNAGKSFAYIRSSYGTASVDDDFTTNATHALSAGLYVGYYHFAYYSLSGHTPNSEADHYWNTIAPYMAADGKHLMPFLDVENGSSVYSGGGTLTAWVDNFCLRLEQDAAKAGFSIVPLIYCSSSPAGSYFAPTTNVPDPAQNFPLDVANYPGSPNYTTGDPPAGTGDWQTWQMWQYTSTGTVSGIHGNVDHDVLNGDANTLRDYFVQAWAVGASVTAHPQPTTYATGNALPTTVKVYATSNLKAASDTYTSVPADTLGTITAKGSAKDGDGNQRWRVTFSNGVTGWIVQDANYVVRSMDAQWVPGTTVTTTTGVNAWASSSAQGSSAAVGTGVAGTIIQGPIYGNGFQRWQVQFNNGVKGWVAEDLMSSNAPGVVSNPNPANSTANLDTLPANFTWTAGANASSYNVYLDGAKKATVTTNSWAHPAIANGTHTWRVDSVNGNLTTTGPTWTFVAGPPPAYTSGSTLYVNYVASGTVIINGSSGSNIVVSQNGTNYTFPAASVAAIDVAATAGDDALTLFGNIAAPISFDDGGGSDTITINPSAQVTFAADVPGARVVLGSGAFLEAAVPLHLASLSIGGGTVYLDPSGNNTLAVGDLSITGGGNLDLSDNALVWDYAADAGTPADTLRTYLNRARNGGTWDGSGGIGSSEAYADPTHTAALGYLEASSLGVTSFAGVDVDGTALVVKYTVAGDVNLNGAVDGDDYALTDRAFARNAANPHWLNGDFDYDGVLGASDYLLLDTSALVQGGGTPSPALLATREATFGPAYVSALTAALSPEPETTAVTTTPADPATPPFSEAPISDPAPEAVVTGPKTVRRNKPAHFQFAVADVPKAGQFTYRIDWNGDSVADQAVTGDGASVALGHRFAQAGQGGITLWVTDDVTGLTSDPTSFAFRIL